MRVDEETWAEIRRVYETTTESIARIAVRHDVGSSTIHSRSIKEGWGRRPSGVRVIPKPPPPAYSVPAALKVIAPRRPGEPATVDLSQDGTRHDSDGKPAPCSAPAPVEDAPSGQAGGAGNAKHPEDEAGSAAAHVAGRREPDTPAMRALRLLRLVDLQLDLMETSMTQGVTPQDQERQARALDTLMDNAATALETAADTDKFRDSGRGVDDGGYLEAERLRREIAERLERLNAQWLAQTKSE